MLCAIAIGRVLKDYHPKYKWPNDILIKDKKVCGILIEREQDNLVIGKAIATKGKSLVGKAKAAAAKKARGVGDSVKGGSGGGSGGDSGADDIASQKN